MNNHYYSKDGVTVATILDTRRALANGQYPVRIRVSYRRVRSYYPTGKSMMPDDWQRLNATRLHSLVSVRKDIENSFELVRQAVEDLTSKGCFTLELLGARLKGAGATSVNASIQIKEAGIAGNIPHRDGGYSACIAAVDECFFKAGGSIYRRIYFMAASIRRVYACFG